MKLTDHLLYIDITQICGIGCSFCMYSDKHKGGINLTLTEKSKKNLKGLINDNAVKRISISGEGEPLNNIETFHNILDFSHKENEFEFISSGFLPKELMYKFFIDTNNILLKSKSRCNIRISSDSYHLEKIKHRSHGLSIDWFIKNPKSLLSFSFRSIDTDKEFTRNFLVTEAMKFGYHAKIKEVNNLTDEIIINENYVFKIDYKNLVKPENIENNNFLDLKEYIKEIEIKTNKKFTLGRINVENNGMDVTIKPDGSIFFYGIENIKLGNINLDDIDWGDLEDHVKNNKLINNLYRIPFMDLIKPMKNNLILNEIVRRNNNPYWVMKELEMYPDILKEIASND